MGDAPEQEAADQAIGDIIGALRAHERLHEEPLHIVIRRKRGGKRVNKNRMNNVLVATVLSEDGGTKK